MKTLLSFTARPGSERWPVCHPTGIVRQFCSGADSWETVLPSEYPRREPDTAVRNPAPGVVVIQGWPVNRGLYSSRAIAVLRPGFPVTSLSSCAAFLLAGQSNFFESSPRWATLRQIEPKSVFTQTHSCHHNLTLLRLSLPMCGVKRRAGMNQKAKAAWKSSNWHSFKRMVRLVYLVPCSFVTAQPRPPSGKDFHN